MGVDYSYVLMAGVNLEECDLTEERIEELNNMYDGGHDGLEMVADCYGDSYLMLGEVLLYDGGYGSDEYDKKSFEKKFVFDKYEDIIKRVQEKLNKLGIEKTVEMTSFIHAS